MPHIDTSANLNPWRRKPLAEKNLLALGMLAIAVGVPSWQSALLVAAVMTAVTLWLARVDFTTWWKTMTAPFGFLLIGVVTVAVRVQGWHVGLAPHGLELAGRLAARALAGLTCLLFMALTTPATDFVQGLRRIGVPVEITDLALLMYRFLFLLLDTAASMNAAQAARLGHSSYRRHMNSLALLIANLLPRALARAQGLETGLAARGWRGELQMLNPVRPVTPRNIVLILGLECLVLACGIWLK